MVEVVEEVVVGHVGYVVRELLDEHGPRFGGRPEVGPDRGRGQPGFRSARPLRRAPPVLAEVPGLAERFVETVVVLSFAHHLLEGRGS